MAAVTAPDDRTREDIGVRMTPAPAVSIGVNVARVRVVFAGLIVLALVVTLLLWGLLH
jgi:hypothetical protein